jgi:methyltransferase (TIGR00027 family)
LEASSNQAASRIEHVSDTALMVAACRAMETAEPDGLIRDPFAERLAGERGMAIARGLSILEWIRLGVGLRAGLMDRLLTDLLRDGQVRTVLNLGAGLDTRPWRLDLPPALRWIEADFPAMLEYKAARLTGAEPQCRFEQVAADLSNARERLGVFERVGAEEALMITEGLLMYLPRADLMSLASEAPQFSGVRHWMLDATSKEMMRLTSGGMHSAIENLRPKDYLAGQAILDAAQEAGWSVRQKRTYAEGAAARPKRARELARTLMKRLHLPSIPGDPVSGVYLLAQGKSNV